MPNFGRNYRNWEIQPILSYEQAVAREAFIKPIRGDDDIKPLGIRKNKHMRILKHPNGNIACRLYDTDVVTFKPNGDVAVMLNGWASDSTCDFASMVLDQPFYKFDSRVWCRVQYEGEIKNFPLRSYGENKFRMHGTSLVIRDPLKHVIHKINRAGANSVRERYANFRAYLKRTMRLREDEHGRVHLSDREFGDIFGHKKGSSGKPLNGLPDFPAPLWVGPHYKLETKYWAEFQQLIEDHGIAAKTQDIYKAFLWLASGIERYREHGCCYAADVSRAFDEVIFFLHRGEVFSTIDCWGQEVKDPYAKFFS